VEVEGRFWGTTADAGNDAKDGSCLEADHDALGQTMSKSLQETSKDFYDTTPEKKYCKTPL
jgi:hypothetical protein